MIHCDSIQADPEGLYSDIPSTFISLRNVKRASQIILDMEERKKDLLKRAKKGDKEAIQVLKERYKITLYIHRGKKII